MNLLPTRVNLARRKIIEDDLCELCKCALENGIHVLWECGVVRGIWAGSLVKLQKFPQGQGDVLQLFAELLQRLSTEEFEVFLVVSWLIWNQRNLVIHGGKVKDPRQILKRAEDFLTEYHQAQDQLVLPQNVQQQSSGWQPPHSDHYKLNFDAAIYTDLGCSEVGAIIRNEWGEVMAALSAKGSFVQDSEEAETLACRKALEFAIDVGISYLIIEGDNVFVMRAVASNYMDGSKLGNVLEDIHCLVNGLRWSSISCMKRSANTVAHSLACFARNVPDELVWIEDSP